MTLPASATVPVSPRAAERPPRLRRGPRADEFALMRGLADGPAPVTRGPIGRCCKRGWCRAVLADAATERRSGPALFELTSQGRALLAEAENEKSPGSADTIEPSPGLAHTDKDVLESDEMTVASKHDGPILVTGAAGAVGSVGREITRLLLADGFRVRAMVHKEDSRADALRAMGAEVVSGDLTDLESMHRVIEGCRRVYFGMSISPTYLEATVNTAAVALHHGVDAFVNMSQMTVSQMSVTASTDSPQQKLHWLSEQALAWSKLPVVTVRPTMFLEGFFLLFAAPGIREGGELAIPMGRGKTSPISSLDVARVVAAILRDPAPHVGQVYNLTGPESADLDHYAAAFSDALGRTIRYRDVPHDAWSGKLRELGLPPHVANHVSTMAVLTREGRYDRMTDDVLKLTGEKPVGMREFVARHADAFRPAQSGGA